MSEPLWNTETFASYFAAVRQVCTPKTGHLVAETAARAFCARIGCAAPQALEDPGPGLRIGVHDEAWPLAPARAALPETPWMWARITAAGEGELTASHPSLLYALVELLVDGLTSGQQRMIAEGLLLEATFDWHRPLYDYVLTQTARTARTFEAEPYIRHLAASGFTHLEINGLATHVPMEPGVPGEFYSPFYTYCPPLHYFVESTLTKGLYPAAYLEANLNRARHLAALGRRYGLRPGFLCFEPRTLPEPFFQRYPTLRGARVDHPFRSHLPRYTMAQDHPATRAHYRALMQRLMEAIPDLAYLSIWTNDSGSGFEHTASLYVGRNGGPYLIREWRSHEKIAEAAGQSALRWMRLLQKTAAEVNPDFEVSLRIEPFKVEHDTLIKGMGAGLTLEAPSLLVRGYHLPYRHPVYPEQESAAGTLHHTEMDPEEAEKLAAFRAAGIEPHVHYAASGAFNLEPLLGIPFPRMLHRKLTALRECGIRRTAALGGLFHPEAAPYWPNPAAIRAAQLNPARFLDDVLTEMARFWAGPTYADRLLALWRDVEEAVSRIPIVPLYGNFGFVWLRTWVRPFVPDIEAIPEADRRYYERFMVSTPNNPAINDLGRDVLFDLITESAGYTMARQFDENVGPRLEAVLQQAADCAANTEAPVDAVFVDLRDRIRALRCWAATQRNTCAWVAGVYGYLRSQDEREEAHHRAYVQDVVANELANTRDLLNLWETSTTEFMLVSNVSETSFIYGENFGELLRKKIQLSEHYGHREPHIDRDIVWRL